MFFLLRRFWLPVCFASVAATASGGTQEVSDSLQRRLVLSADPAERVQLLLDLKDLNEDNSLNFPLSLRLFGDAVQAGDTYAACVAAVPIVRRYAYYPEQEDTLRRMLASLERLTPGTPQEGFETFLAANIDFNRLFNRADRDKSYEAAREILHRYKAQGESAGDIYHQTRDLMLYGYARAIVRSRDAKSRALAEQTRIWQQAFDLLPRMPSLTVRRHFAEIIYYLLSTAYDQAGNYEALEALTEQYVDLVAAFNDMLLQSGRRRYLYVDNAYVHPYHQLIQSAIKVGRREAAERHFDELRRRMLAAEGVNLMRNRSYLYEVGYIMEHRLLHYDRSVAYADSLIYLIEHDQGYFRMMSEEIRNTYRDRSFILQQAGRYRDACESYRKTYEVQDSMFRWERDERMRAIVRKREADRLKLERTQAVIRNRMALLVVSVIVGLLVIGTGIYLFIVLRRNKRLEAEILRHSRKACEGERMKSNFVNTICRGIGPPLGALDRAAERLIAASRDDGERRRDLEEIRANTARLLSVLDNMLEAANLDSLTDSLRLEPVDIDEVCRAELLAAERLQGREGVEYRIEADGRRCVVATHAKYFAFVVRALLDNAGRFTRRGSITLRYGGDRQCGVLRVEVADTGCGVAPERREEIFRSTSDASAASHGLSLGLCRTIATRLGGSIRLDEQYTEGACFLFTIPLEP